jgi:hypothetical protein
MKVLGWKKKLTKWSPKTNSRCLRSMKEMIEDMG